MKKSLIVFVAVLVLFTTTGCIKISSTKGSASSTAGVFVSQDYADNWTNSSSLMTPGILPGDITGVEALFLEFDPTDSSILYLGARQAGLLYSYNAGAGWNVAISEGTVRGVAISSKDHCTAYAAVDARLLKTEDCNLNWKTVYFTGQESQLVSAVAIDHNNPKVVWIGLSTGEVLKSSDAGKSWAKKKTLHSRVAKILVSSFDPNVVYVAGLQSGLSKTTDAGNSWQSLNSQLKDFGKDVYYYRGLVEDKKNQGVLYYATAIGLLKTTTGGQDWTALNLLTPGEQTNIFALEIDPNNSNNLYYGTLTSFYRSTDGGVNWITKKMPTTRSASAIRVHPKNSAVLYMGVKNIK